MTESEMKKERENNIPDSKLKYRTILDPVAHTYWRGPEPSGNRDKMLKEGLSIDFVANLVRISAG